MHNKYNNIILAINTIACPAQAAAHRTRETETRQIKRRTPVTMRPTYITTWPAQHNRRRGLEGVPCCRNGDALRIVVASHTRIEVSEPGMHPCSPPSGARHVRVDPVVDPDCNVPSPPAVLARTEKPRAAPSRDLLPETCRADPHKQQLRWSTMWGLRRGTRTNACTCKDSD